MEQKGNKYQEKIHKPYHEHKEHVELHPIIITPNVVSPQHRWYTIQEYGNKFVNHYSPVLVVIKVGLESKVTEVKLQSLS